MAKHVTRTIALSLLLCLWFLPAVGAQDPVVLTHFFYSSHGTAWLEFLQDRAAAFSELYPHIQVEIMEGGTGAGYFDKLNLMLAAGTPPDATDFHPGIAGPFIAQGVFADLRPYLERDGLNLSDLTIAPVVEVLTDVNGAIWSLPGDLFPVVTYFNADLFSAAGLMTPIDLGDDWDWENALLAARRLTVDYDGDGIIDQYGLDRMYARWYIWVWQAGGTFYDRLVDPTQSFWTDAKVAEGFAFPLAVFEQNLAPRPGMPNLANYHFWTGRSAMSLVDGPGIVRASLRDVDFKWDVAPQVRGPENAGSEIAVSGYQMVAQTRHPEETWLWLSFLALHQESAEQFVRITGRTPALSGLISEFPRLNDHAPNNWLAYFQTASLPQSQSQYVLPEGSAISTIVNPRVNQVFTGQVPFETAAREIHELVTLILNNRHGL